MRFVSTIFEFQTFPSPESMYNICPPSFPISHKCNPLLQITISSSIQHRAKDNFYIKNQCLIDDKLTDFTCLGISQLK